jgi:hypothetical protein
MNGSRGIYEIEAKKEPFGEKVKLWIVTEKNKPIIIKEMKK